MNKKFMNALLFSAALLSAGVVTSCKDYDDDIDELRNQDEANKADLTQQLEAVNSSISSLQSAQTGLQSDIEAAEKAVQEAQASADEAAIAAAEAKQAALEGQQAAIDEAAKSLTAAKEELTSLIQQGDNALQEDIDAVEAALTICQGHVEALLAFQGQTEETLAELDKAYQELNTTVKGISAKVEDLLLRIGKAETAITSQEAALKSYQETNDVAIDDIQADLSALAAQVEKWKGLDPAELEAMGGEIEQAQQDIATLNSRIATVNENLAVLYTAIYKGITHIEMVYGLQKGETGKKYAESDLVLLSDVAKYTYTFGTKGEKHNELNPKAEMENAQSFVEGERRRLSETLLVRVTPADASLSAEEISLVDTKGTDLVSEGYVRVVSVEKFQGTLTTRAAQNENGLYEITIEVGSKADDTQSFDFEKAFKEVTTMNDHQVMFALGVNQNYGALKDNAATAGGVRKVTSSYELTFGEDRKGEVGSIGFSVYETNNEDLTKKRVNEIQNRWDGDVKEDKAPYEYQWKDDIEVRPTWEYVNPDFNASVTRYDARRNEDCFAIAQDTKFTVELDDETKQAKYFYISLDRDFAGESDASELRAWNTFQEGISGDIDKVLDIDACDGKATLSINLGDYEYDDEILGFRVYAVNADGTYVDPDGRAFYVHVGKAAVALPAVKTDIVVNPYDANYYDYSDYVLVNGIPETIIEAANIASYDIDSKMIEPIYKDNDGTLISGNVFKVYYYDANKKELIWNDLKHGKGWQNVKYIRTQFEVGAAYLVDDHVYTGTITVKADDGRILATIPVEAKKSLPQTAPEGFGIKANQINGGIHINYLEPTKYGQYGEGLLTRVFNGMDRNDEGAEHYIVTFENARRDGQEPEDLVVTGTNGFMNYSGYRFEVAREFIDNTVKHATKVEFDWGKISYTFNEIQDRCVASNHTITVEEFETIFSCIYDAEIMTWDWAESVTGKDDKNPVITYAETYNAFNPSGLTWEVIESTNSFNDTDFGKTLKEFVTARDKEFGSAIDRMNGQYKSIALYTNVDDKTTKNEYFEPYFDYSGNLCFKPTKHDPYDNPTDNVESTLRIVYVDIFGHDVVIDLPVTVEKR